MSLASFVTYARAWMGKPAARALLVLCGLGVLSLVGRFAVAGGQVPRDSGRHPKRPAAPIAPLPSPVPIGAVMPEQRTDDAGAPAPVTHSRSASEDRPVYLNEATLENLRRLPGVGEKRGLAILELRRKLGRFHQVEDLLHVKGVGRSTLRRLRPLMRINHPALDAGSP